MLIRYLAALDLRRSLLWSALLWYGVMMVRHGPQPFGVWLNSASIALVVGLILITNAVPSGVSWRSLGFWPTARFFLIPFCVSSFSSALRDTPLLVIFPGNAMDNLLAGATVVVFLLAGWIARRVLQKAA